MTFGVIDSLGKFSLDLSVKEHVITYTFPHFRMGKYRKGMLANATALSDGLVIKSTLISL
jgi:hypothetical protein